MFRNLSFAAALVAASALSFAAFAAEPPKPPAPVPLKPSLGSEPAAGYVHTVIFHLKKDVPDGTADKIVADCHALLESIPTVRGVKAGRPAAEDQSTPKVASRDYDVALVVFFDDAAGLKTYLEHEQHLKFVHTYEKDFETVQVFDFIDPTTVKK
jgi:hypothetical protein